MKTIYILMATYNGERYIAEQLDSLLAQTYKEWVLWIHDDNSIDGTLDIISKYENMYPNKIYLINDNISTGSAKDNFNYLLTKIDDNYEYIMFCDQDDIWLENKIELTLNKMIEVEKNNKNKPVLIHTDLKVVDENLNTISHSFFDYQKIEPNWADNLDLSIVQNSVTGCTMMINKIVKNISLPMGENAIMHDWWILLKVLQNNGVVAFLNKSTILYRQHNFNNTGAKGFSIFCMILNIQSIFKYQNMAKDIGLNYSLFRLFLLKIKRLC